jgi:hypothetical protein
MGAVVSELLAASLDGSMGLRALSIGPSMKRADSGRILSSEVRRANAQRMAGKLATGADR